MVTISDKRFMIWLPSEKRTSSVSYKAPGDFAIESHFSRLAILLWHFSGSQVVKIADAFNMLGCLAVVVKLYHLWNGSMNEACFGREWKQSSNPEIWILSVRHVLEWQISSATGFFEEARQSSFDWLIWIGETKTATVSTDALNGLFFLCKPALLATCLASPSRSQCLVFCRTNVDCREAHVTMSFLSENCWVPYLFPAERKRYPNVSLFRGNNLEDYLNRLGGTKVHNELKGKG